MRRPPQAVHTPKAIGIDCQRLLVAVSQQESNRRFIGGFRWDHVPLTGATICDDKHGWFVLAVCSTPACGQTTRARRSVTLAAFESSFHVLLVDLNRAFEVWQRCFQRPQEALDATVDCLVGYINFHVKSETRIEANVGVNSEKPFF